MKIENDAQLDNFKREIERMEFQISGAQEQIDEFRAAIAEYEKTPERIAEGLSEAEKLAFLLFRNAKHVCDEAFDRLRILGIIDEYDNYTPLGLQVFAELQKDKPLGCTHEVVRVNPGGTTENRGFYLDKEAANFAMSCMRTNNPLSIYEVREL